MQQKRIYGRVNACFFPLFLSVNGCKEQYDRPFERFVTERFFDALSSLLSLFLDLDSVSSNSQLLNLTKDQRRKEKSSQMAIVKTRFSHLASC